MKLANTVIFTITTALSSGLLSAPKEPTPPVQKPHVETPGVIDPDLIDLDGIPIIGDLIRVGDDEGPSGTDSQRGKACKINCDSDVRSDPAD
ncbi:MAG: hypothetical protein HRU19_02685 [Pseudobacteriovorax sp.]|nr:hypothetical protein [Pseudobacteriovorax sp.]